MKSRYYIIFIISLFYAIIVGSGFYGFGNDFYIAYYKGNLSWGKWFDRMGYIVSTLYIFNIHLGVYIVSFILALSSSNLINNFFITKKINSHIFFVFISIVTFHTWPIIMSTSNAMKQGLCMSLIFFSLSFLISKNNKMSFIFMFLSIFFHRVGIFFLTILILMFLIRFLGKKIIKLEKLSYFLISLLITCIFIFYLPLVYSIEEPTRIISGDFRIHFFIISIIFITFFTINHHFLSNNYILFLYIFSFVSNSLLYLELNWQYERLSMILIIPYMLSTGIIFNKRSCYFIWNFLFCGLFFATVVTGMFDSLK